MQGAARGATRNLWRAIAACVGGALLVVGCSPGEVVQVEWDPVATPTSEPRPTAAPVATTPAEPTVEPAAAAGSEATADPTPAAVNSAPTAAVATATATTEPTLVPEPTVPQPTAALAATVVPAPTAAAAPTAAPTSPPAPSDSQAVLAANGGEVYTLNCARCHAESGLGTAQYSGLVGVGSRYSTAGMIAELTNGHPVTFGFADKLSADEIASVVAYVKATFQ